MSHAPGLGLDPSPTEGQASLNAAWAQALAQACQAHLAAGQKRQVVMSPGSRSTPLVLAFVEHQQVCLHTILDERAAGFFALGLARASRHAVILLCTSGSAAAHYLPAVIEAFYSHVPLLVISADRPADLHGCGAPQTIDQHRLFGVHSRYSADLGTPDRAVLAGPAFWQTQAMLALAAAEGAAGGPTHLNVAFREPLWDAQAFARPTSRIPLQVRRGVLTPCAATLTACAQSFAGEPRGVIVCGPGVGGDLLTRRIEELARHLGWPVLAEPAANCAGRGDIFVRHYDALLRDKTCAAALAPKVVLRLGALPTSKVLQQWLQQHASGRTWLVHPGGDCSDPTHSLAALVVCCPEAFCLALCSVLPAAGLARPYLAAFGRADAAAAQALTAYCDTHFFEGSVARQVAQSLPSTALLWVANSLAIRDVDSFATAPLAQVLCSRGANGIDGTLAALLGAAAACSHKPVVGLMGDLAFLHDVGALQLARQGSAAALAVVVNNGGGAIFDSLPIKDHPSAYEKHFRTPQQADMGALCAAAAVPHVRVVDASGLACALRERLHDAGPGLQVIEVDLRKPSGHNARLVYEGAWLAVRDGWRDLQGV